MNHDHDNDGMTKGDPATQAFARLEGQVALMRRAVEHLAAERADIVIPDYGATLGEMAVRLGAIVEALAAVAESPAMRLIPETLAQRIEAAAEAARRSDRDQLAEARRQFDQGARHLSGLIGTARTVAEQRQRLAWAAGGGLVAGILLWSVLPGAIARSVPESWHWPERMAMQTLGENSPWDAGARLMRASDPEAWRALTEAADLLRDNREEIEECRKKAARSGKAVRCAVDVGPEGAR